MTRSDVYAGDSARPFAPFITRKNDNFSQKKNNHFTQKNESAESACAEFAALNLLTLKLHGIT